MKYELVQMGQISSYAYMGKSILVPDTRLQKPIDSHWFKKVHKMMKFNKDISLHEKPYSLFPNVLKRCLFQKNRTGIWSFLYHQEKWYFFFPKIWYYSLGGKWKMIFLKKNTWKYDIFLICSEKMVFPKKNCTGIWSFLYHEQRWRFFSSKIWYFERLYLFVIIIFLHYRFVYTQVSL